MRTQSASLAILIAMSFSSPAFAEAVIGVIGSYSGFCNDQSGGLESKVLKSAVENAVRQINQRAGVAGEKIIVTIKDAGCDIKQAYSAAENLSAEKALLVVWQNFMGRWGAIGNKLSRSGMVHISPRTDDPRFAAAAVEIWATAAARLDSRSRGDESKLLVELERGEFDTVFGTLRPVGGSRTDVDVVDIDWSLQGAISYSIAKPLSSVAILAQFGTGGGSSGGGSFGGGSFGGGSSGGGTSGGGSLGGGAPGRGSSGGGSPSSGLPSSAPSAAGGDPDSSTKPGSSISMPPDRPPPSVAGRPSVDGRQDDPPSTLIIPQDAITPKVREYLQGGAWTRQEAPGRDVGGTATVPTPANNSGEAVVIAASIVPTNSDAKQDDGDRTAVQAGITLPALPQPSETDMCKFPDGAVSIPSDDAFLKLYLASVKENEGRSSVPYCREGFADVVIMDTGRPKGDSLCSGVLLRGGWVLTAKHCIGDELRSGGVFQIPANQVDCLRRNSADPENWEHPAKKCRLKPVDVDLNRAAAMTEGDLAIIPPQEGVRVQRGADITKVHDRPRALVTFAGYGASTVIGEDKEGLLRVGWGIADWRESSRDATSIDIVGVSPGGLRRSTTPCGGDSGGPAFLGRIFGYDNERHELFGLVVSRTNKDNGCKREGAIDTSTTIVPLQSSTVLNWVCKQTGKAVTACRR